MLTLPVKGHLWSTKSPSIASLGVLKPFLQCLERKLKLTESDFLVESNTTAGLFGDELLAVEENSNLFLIGFFVL